MADSELTGVPECELEAALLAIRDSGAECFDPVSFKVISAMADKAVTHRPQTARLVRQRALVRLIAYQGNFQREQQKAQPLAAQIEKQHPEHGEQARQLFTSHHFAQLQQLASKLQRNATDKLLAQLSEQLLTAEPLSATAQSMPLKPRDFLRQQELELTRSAAASASAADLPWAHQQTQLRSAQQCREALAQLEAEHLVLQASRAAPEDSGPLNPQKLAIRSLLTLRDLSPGYLGRFVSYLDTLAWLEQVD